MSERAALTRSGQIEFRSCRSEAEALAVLDEFGDDARILAGGTDLMIQYQRGEINPSVFLHIQKIPELGGITVNGSIAIGALTTHRRLVRHDEIRRHLPALAEAAATVGGWQTQEAGTLGGNLCNASPAADTVPPLLMADAVVGLASPKGRRSMPLDQFLLGRRLTARQADELLTGIDLELPPPRTGEVYLKVGPRSAMEVALVGLAARLTLGEDGATVEDARVAVCSVGPRPFRAVEAEAVLTGSRLEGGAVAEAGELLARAASPIDDFRATGAYRRRVL
ncbi:MAG TPA: xanthine dehydrogenase family protein subunit M, partial [Acidimicrobiia bacterium]|nr:xanthine dehydrogenase family protein subunit M [Acidimicrobiia bacterium]